MRWFLLLLLVANAAAQSAGHAATEGEAALANDARMWLAADYEKTETVDVCLKIIREDRCNQWFFNKTETPYLYPLFLESGVGCCGQSGRPSIDSRSGTPLEIGQFDITETFFVEPRPVKENVLLEATFTAIGTLNGRAEECGHPFCEEMTFTVVGRRYRIEKPWLSKVPAESARPVDTQTYCPRPDGIPEHRAAAADEPAATASAHPAKTPEYHGVSAVAAQVAPGATYRSTTAKHTYPKPKYAKAPSYGKSKYPTKEHPESPAYDTKSKYGAEEYPKPPAYHTKGKYDTKEYSEDAKGKYDTKEYSGNAKSKYDTKEHPESPSYDTKSKYDSKEYNSQDEYKPYKPEGYYDEDTDTYAPRTAQGPRKAYMGERIRVYSGTMTINSRLHKTEYSQGWFEMVTVVQAAPDADYVSVPEGETVYDPYTYKLSLYKPKTY